MIEIDQAKLLKIEHALSGLGGEDKYRYTASVIQAFAVKYAPKNTSEFLTDLFDLIDKGNQSC